MRLPRFVVWAAAALCFLCADAAFAKVFKLYYLGGQSNMDGYGKVADLSEDQRAPISGVWIFQGNPAPDGVATDGRGKWAELQPGHGADFSSDGTANKYSDKFGVELSFARRLKELEPDSPIALVKYSRGGTALDQDAAGMFGAWEPDFEGGTGDGRGINQYDHFLATLKNAFADADIDDDGETDTLVPAGILWMQGESDAYYSQEIADRYQGRLARLMDLVRAALRADDVTVVIGRISDSQKSGPNKIWPYAETVRAAQAAFAEKDGHAALVTSTDSYGYSDPYHYDSAGFLDLGRQFADALAK